MRWTVRKKMLAGYGAILALLILVLSWAFVDLWRLGQASDAILRENYKSILAAESMIDAIERQDSATLLLILDFQEEALENFRENESVFLQSFARAEDNITIDGEEEIIGDIQKQYSRYLVEFSRLRDLTRNGQRDDIASYYHDTLNPTFVSVRDGCTKLREINQQTMFDASDRARRVSRWALFSIGIIGIGAVIAGIGFSLFLSHLLVKPLENLTEAAHEVGEGSYDVEVPVTSSDELGKVAAEFNKMVKKLESYRQLDLQKIVTEKRRSDAIISSIDDGIIVIDEEFKIININKTAAYDLDIDRQHATDRHFLEVVNNEPLFDKIRETVETGQTIEIEEGDDVLSIEKDEQTEHYLFSIVPVRASEEVLRGAVLVLRDVTHLKELDQLKSEFVMTASHELKTPLTSIEMSIDLLREQLADEVDADQKELFDAAHEEVHRLKALLHDLLDLSKIESGRVDMQFSMLPVTTLVDKATSALGSQLEDKDIELKTDIPDDIPEVRADPNKISWVLTNLLANAVRYTDEGGEISVTVEDGSNQVYISVTDSGTGIPEEYQSKIFDKFVQVHGEDGEGTGLGLAICREVVRAHGGTIWVESEMGEGSTFTFTLPVKT